LPGLGLLLLRLCLSLALIKFAVAGQPDAHATSPATPDWLAAAAGLLLLAGLWTPVMGALVALAEALIVFLKSSPTHEDMWFRVFLGLLAISLALLGPGAWSIDARLFGRKRFDIDRSQTRK
jgi:uncharacterized membrane protein YphA (DoxX/SURF4 family)